MDTKIKPVNPVQPVRCDEPNPGCTAFKWEHERKNTEDKAFSHIFFEKLNQKQEQNSSN